MKSGNDKTSRWISLFHYQKIGVLHLWSLKVVFWKMWVWIQDPWKAKRLVNIPLFSQFGESEDSFWDAADSHSRGFFMDLLYSTVCFWTCSLHVVFNLFNVCSPPFVWGLTSRSKLELRQVHLFWSILGVQNLTYSIETLQHLDLRLRWLTFLMFPAMLAFKKRRPLVNNLPRLGAKNAIYEAVPVARVQKKRQSSPLGQEGFHRRDIQCVQI